MLQLRDSRVEALIEAGTAYEVRGLPDFPVRERQNKAPFATSGLSPNAMIDTVDGVLAARDLRPGMRVLTREHGLQPVLWVGRNRNAEDYSGDNPVRIRPGALGQQRVGENLVVSVGHKLLIQHVMNELLFGSDVVMCRADHLLHVDGVDVTPRAGVNWCHILLPSHAMIRAGGTWVESLQPDMQAIRNADPNAAEDILDVAPKLSFEHGMAAYVSNYPILNQTEAGLLDFS